MQSICFFSKLTSKDRPQNTIPTCLPACNYKSDDIEAWQFYPISQEQSPNHRYDLHWINSRQARVPSGFHCVPSSISVATSYVKLQISENYHSHSYQVAAELVHECNVFLVVSRRPDQHTILDAWPAERLAAFEEHLRHLATITSAIGIDPDSTLLLALQIHEDDRGRNR
ncbi:hypothetical protein EV356DRAFT_210278 [Viridothelium virens]|uniref:Uncharacterized protein n=1 Tax=Viridothelium virens TaxID=1048519 RepID=A0A6A6H6G6_VIRVR|nr:hypothetical protein EV356DRAFT_210278 [Viridothelium virens]